VVNRPLNTKGGSTPCLQRVQISSLATYVPPRVLTNADFEKMVETTDEWILRRVVIRELHIVDPGVATSDLAK
jgi:3-oxoacyl-[acyl-carrier-protein] synthase-3